MMMGLMGSKTPRRAAILRRVQSWKLPTKKVAGPSFSFGSGGSGFVSSVLLDLRMVHQARDRVKRRELL